MKKWIATIAIIILSWSGSITAVELSKEGCKMVHMGTLEKELLKWDSDEEVIENLMNDIVAIDAAKNYEEWKRLCKKTEILMEIYGLKENTIRWKKLFGIK